MRGPVRHRPLQPADRAPLEAILRATGSFAEAEVAVALELIDLGIGRGDASGSSFVVADGNGEVLGYGAICASLAEFGRESTCTGFVARVAMGPHRIIRHLPLEALEVVVGRTR